MRYEQTKKLSNRQFKRLVGVQQRTFDEMIKVLKDAASLKQTLLLSKQVKLGRPSFSLLTILAGIPNLLPHC